MINLTGIIVGVVILIFAITGIVVTANGYSLNKISQVVKYAGIIVDAAEQIYTGQKKGPERKAYVTELMENFIAKYNLKIDFDLLDAIIEAEVYKLNHPEDQNS